MTLISKTVDPNESNHIRYDYRVDKIFLAFPSDQRKYTFVNGTESERTIAAGTLVGITTADQTIAQPVESDATDGSEIPVGILLYDTVIAAGAAEEVEALVGFNGAVFADKIVLEKTGDTLATVITNLGQSVRNALLNANANISIEDAAQNVSGYKDTQV